MSRKQHKFSILKLTIVILITALHVTLANAAVGDVLISDASKRLSLGETWNLKEGYTLTLKQIDLSKPKLWMELRKNGEFIAERS